MELRMRGRPGFTVAAAAIVIVVLTAVVARSAGGSAPITAEAARAAVVAMVPEATGLTVSGPVDSATGRHFTVSSSSVRASVDATVGRVTGVLLLDRRPTAGVVSLSADEVMVAAGRFLEAHGIPHDGMQASVRLVNHGASNEYEVTWQRLDQGVEVPDSRSVRVDAATGRVFWYADVRRPFSSPPAPLVDYDRATELAAAASGFEQPTIVEGTLKLIAREAGGQDLVWLIEVAGPLTVKGSTVEIFAYVWVEVDAITGEATIVRRG
jgi:hypothetical protein